MRILRNFYQTSLQVNKDFLIGLCFVLGFLGFLDATYLTILHYKNVIPPCTIAHGCETVLTSSYATFLKIPISLLGVFFYVCVLVGLLLFVQTRNKLFTSLLLLVTTLGLLVAGYLVYLQAFVIHAFCQYCLASEFIDFLLFDCAWWLWRRTNR